MTTKNETTALALPETGSLRAGATRALILAETLKQEAEQRALLATFVKDHLVEKTDYGTIPGTQKKTLFKPGAEKLLSIFRCKAAFRMTERIEDWDKGLFHYEFRCRISSMDSGAVVAEGYGSANSKEGRYRWRNA